MGDPRCECRGNFALGQKPCSLLWGEAGAEAGSPMSVPAIVWPPAQFFVSLSHERLQRTHIWFRPGQGAAWTWTVGRLGGLLPPPHLPSAHFQSVPSLPLQWPGKLPCLLMCLTGKGGAERVRREQAC